MPSEIKKLPGQTESYPSATEKNILDFEQEFGITIPPTFRKFLLSYNGGCFLRCRVDMSHVDDSPIRPVPRRQWLQDLRSLARPHECTVSLHHDSELMGILREGDDVLLQIGSMEDANFLYVATTTERTDEIWLKTTILPVLEGDKFVHYDSEWFFIAPNMDAFLRLLRYEPEPAELDEK